MSSHRIFKQRGPAINDQALPNAGSGAALAPAAIGGPPLPRSALQAVDGRVCRRWAARAWQMRSALSAAKQKKDQDAALSRRPIATALRICSRRLLFRCGLIEGGKRDQGQQGPEEAEGCRHLIGRDRADGAG